MKIHTFMKKCMLAQPSLGFTKLCEVLNVLFRPFGRLVHARPLICEAKQALQTKVI